MDDIFMVSHKTLDSWSTAPGNNYILPGHIERTCEIVKQQQQLDVCDDVDLAPDLVTAVSQNDRLVGQELRVVAILHSGLYVVRVVHRSPHLVTFLVLDEENPRRIVFEFAWLCPFLPLTNESPAHFTCKTSRDGRFLIVLGPSERDEIPTTRILDSWTWTLTELNLVHPLEGMDLLWPANMEFDIRPKHCHKITMVVTRSACFNPTPYKDPCNGMLVQFDASSRNIKFAQDGPVSSAQIEYIKEGYQLMVLKVYGRRMDKGDQGVLIYNTDTLEVAFKVDLRAIELNCHWRWAMTHILPVYSVCYKYLTLVLWSFNFGNSLDTDVITLQLPYVGDHVFSLQHACRKVIWLSVKQKAENITELKLPKKLGHYITGRSLDSFYPP